MSDRPSQSGVAPEAVLGKAYDARLAVRLWRFMRPHWRLLVIALLLLPFTVGFELAQPYILKIAIDTYIAAHRLAGLGRLALLFIGLVMLQALSAYGQLYTLQLLGQKAMHDLRCTTYGHVLAQRASFFDRMPVGRLLTRMTNDVENLNEMFSILVTLLSDLVKLVSIVVIMLVLDLRLALMTFITMPLLVVVVEYARRVMRRSFREIRVKVAALNAYLQEHISGIKVVQLFCRERESQRDYDKINAAQRDAYIDAIRADASMYALVEAIGVVSAACIAWYAGGRIGHGVLTVGLVVAFVEYINKFFVPVRDLSAKYTVMQSAMAATERIMALNDVDEPDAPVIAEAEAEAEADAEAEAKAQAQAEARAEAAPGEATDGAAVPAVEFRDVHFSYRAGEPVLGGVSFSVKRGNTVAVVGATGSGKSTVIKLLARLYEPDSGRILADGRDIRTLPAPDLRRRLTVISQDVFLFSGTVAQNVRFGREGADRAAVEAALRQVGADRVLAHRGVTADEVVAERGSNFSAGERQLLAFARALVRDPEILILDEATAHVDPETEASIERALEVLMEDRTTLVIAHRLSTIRHADHIVVMSRGQICEQGSREQLIAHGGVYARLERTFAHA